MSNKPTLPNAYTDINESNLNSAPASPSGNYGFVGFSYGGTQASDQIQLVSSGVTIQCYGPTVSPMPIHAISSINDAIALLGRGELVDDIADHKDNGGKKIYAIPLPVESGNEANIGAVTPTRVATSAGTVALAATANKKVVNGFKIKIEIMKTGLIGTAKFRVSTDDGEHFGPWVLMAATYAIPGTNITATFTDNVTGFDDGDIFQATITKPSVTDDQIEIAVQKLIDSNYSFDGIVISADCGADLLAALKTKSTAAEGSPNFRNLDIIVRPARSSSAANAISTAQTLLAATVGSRIQMVTSEMKMFRPVHSDYHDRNVIGTISGRRSSLGISEDLGLFSAGALNNIVEPRTGWTETTIEELDALRTVTVRNFKGTSGYRPTNGWMTDPYSDIKKDAFRLVMDKAARRARIAALNFVKVRVNPADVAGSTEALKRAMQSELDTMAGNGEIVDGEIVIADDQDILTSEELIAEVNVTPFGHMSYIGIRIGFVNPLRQA